jgi:hypothetical protein
LPASINPEWMGWGYWQADQPSPRLTVPPTGAPTAAAQWVAGIQTPTSYIQAMRTASYAGAARCVEFTSGGNTFTHQGTSLFSFEFGNAPQLTGAMNFVGGLAMQSQATLNGSGSGFTGTITSVNTGGGVHTEAPNQLVGGFYGPQANALGAIFQVGTTNGTTYTGAAAAAKQ